MRSMPLPSAVERKVEHRRCVKHFSTQCMSWRCRHCYQRGNVWGISPFFAPSFQPVTPEPELLYFRSLRPANVFERICTPWYKSAYIRVWTTPLLYRAVHISEFQCNFANDGCFWDLSFIHSLNLRSKAFRNSAWWTRRRNLSIFAMFLFSWQELFVWLVVVWLFF